MRKLILYVVSLILSISFGMCIPVSAQKLEGTPDTTAVGQTAVTARIEMPETQDGDSQASEDVKTGDESSLNISLFLLLTSIAILVACVRKEYLRRRRCTARLNKELLYNLIDEL